MKAFAALTVTGLAGLFLLKIMAAVLLPVLGILVGIVALTIKVALIAAVVLFVYSMLRKRSRHAAV